MKRLLATLTLSLLLASCGQQTVKLKVTFDTKDPTLRADLSTAALHVIQGRLQGMKKELLGKTVLEDGDTETITLRVADADTATKLRERLTAPFTMEIMKQVDEGQGDVKTDKNGEFKATGLTTRSFDWVTVGPAVTENGKTMGSVILTFTGDGQKLLKDIFAKNSGGTIGVFVRGILMSKKLIDKADSTLTSISVDGIPSPGLAAAFADDSNVGLHVTFTPLP